MSPIELLEAAIERIEQIDPALNAVVIRWFDHARETARSASLPDGPFRGVPFLLKDLFATYAGQRISNGNVALKNANIIADADTTLVGRFRDAGLVIAGRTNSPELGSVPTTEPIAWGATHNPWDITRTPGGSSGGAAAAVASGMVPLAHASDGGGSIRIPASCCGLVGLKPSQGRITLGPIRDESGLWVELCVSRTVRDTATLLDAVRGPGVGDTVIARGTRSAVRRRARRGSRATLRIGILDHHPQGGHCDPECTEAAQAVGKLLESLGHRVEVGVADSVGGHDVRLQVRRDLEHEHGRGAQPLRGADRAAAHRRRVRADEPGPGRLRQGTSRRSISRSRCRPSPQYRRALQSWWSDGWDLLLTPTLAEVPLKLGTIANDAEHPMDAMVRSGQFVPFTPPFNTSGQPAISLPLQWTDEGLPVGVQLVAAYGREDVLIRVASQLEHAQPWAQRTPDIPLEP